MGSNSGNIFTLANSIIGVSVLAMPFCFKQCGIVLSILMLLFSSMISRLACYFLIKSAHLEKRKNFEMLAFRVYGPTGKLMVELCIIGFMLGTCVAFFVIMGDLGPAILGPPLGFDHPSALRPSVLIGVAVFVVLPLGLLRNVDSLNTICAASILFYVCLVLKVLSEAAANILSWDWIDKVYFWRPSGILQCIPIFSMALSCQTQLFEIFDGLLNTPLEKINGVVRTAINMTTVFYISVGLFGYIAYCNQSFAGNVMMNFSPTLWSEVIKVGFVLSVAVSFPLVIFPCRASIHSLLFSKSSHGYELVSGSSHIPETRFQCITLIIVTLSLVVGLVMPNIEVVLGLIGSTIGVFICVIIPAILFTSLSAKNTNERILAQILVGIGLIIMILGTYANLSATQDVNRENHVPELMQEIKLKQPILPAAVTNIPAKVPEDFIVKEEPKNVLGDFKQNVLQPESKIEQQIVNIKKEKEKPILKPVPNLISKSDIKVIKKNPNEDEPFKESIIGDKLDLKVKDKEKAPPVVNPEPPPKEIPKALPLVPLVLAPEVHDESDLKKVAKERLPHPEVIIKKEVASLNVTKNDIVAVADDSKVDKKIQQQKMVEGDKEVINEKSSNTDKLAKSIVEGIPLPLAVKDTKSIKDKVQSNKVKDKDTIQERGLLEKIEIREKRDVDVEIKEEIKDTNKDKVVVQNIEPTIKVIENNQNENCPRPTDNINKELKINSTEKTNIQESIIKTPGKLSEPEAKLDIDPKLIPNSDNSVQGNNLMPKKRDLKSVQRKEDNK